MFVPRMTSDSSPQGVETDDGVAFRAAELVGDVGEIL
jgi:hypothetical protein